MLVFNLDYEIQLRDVGSVHTVLSAYIQNMVSEYADEYTYNESCQYMESYQHFLHIHLSVFY